MLEFIAWACLILGFILASVGTVVPGIPGAVFVVIGILAHKFLLPGVFAWWVIIVVSFLALISWIVDFFAGVWGAKLGGATKLGILGAAVGGFCGIFFGLPGMILGPFMGAIIGDILAKRRDLAALIKSGSGAALGYFISVLTRIIILVIMMFSVSMGVIFQAS